MNRIGDLDIDLKDRKQLLQRIACMPASKITPTHIIRHNTGIHVQNMPRDPVTGWASIDHAAAQQLGYVKLDLLNLNVYAVLSSRSELRDIMSREVCWGMLQYPDVIKQLYQLHQHVDTVLAMPPTSIEQLAMLLAVIRPGKNHLVGQPWSKVAQEIWLPTDTGYVFKRSHALGYAHVAVMQLNVMALDMLKKSQIMT